MTRFGNSVKNALRGLTHVMRHERNFQIEVVVAVLISVLILYWQLKGWEAVVLILMIMWVLIMELINTAVERVVDILKPRIHPYARLIKDIMATVVLISAAVAVLIGVIIFLPYVRAALGG